MTKHLRRGGALVIALVTLLVVMLIAGTVARSVVASHRQAMRRHNELQAQWLADAALARGLANATRQEDYSGETWRVNVSAEDAGVAEIQVKRGAPAAGFQVLVQAHYPDDPWQRVTISRELAALPREAAP